ncbi:hypothetical protein JI747_014280 [Chryseobacterium sp. RG1]|uniref:DoxX protein n=1 Tax=Chryseobacterium tagetis TaxID=2801334 RepID=A0ABS8A6I9_9FLAO|nr:hypothetical protein [Chryseobacterium tagetis]MCA6068356.1 hypothetical protein [Chryseobacterium tagetis]
MVRRINTFIGAFFLQFIIFFPLNFLNDFQRKFTQFVFGRSTQFLLETIFSKKNLRLDFSSDSYSMLVLLIILLFTSIIFSCLIKKSWASRFLSITEYVCVMYISVVLIKYGIDKIFKTQFPEPESNILFTRLGNLDKDILFWSTMGTSKIYNTIIGSIELFSGILLLFRRSRFSGLLLAVICFTQVFIINISFDISVKFFSVILLGMSIFLVRKKGWELILKIINFRDKTFFDQPIFLPYTTFFKVLILGMIFIKIGLPYFNNGFDTDDKKDSLGLAGAYEIISSDSPYQYLFFHKDHYLIFMEKSSEKMISFHYEISFDQHIIIEDDQHTVSKHLLVKNQKDDSIIFSYNHQIIKAKSVDSKGMNALQDRFHILVD